MTATAGYAICTEPRSGSNFLCQALAAQGVLGRPLEYFNGSARRTLESPDYPDDPQAQLARILDSATPNGVYGLKLFSAQFDQAAPHAWAERLPDLRFIHLERRDILGQAISWVRAEQTGRYRASAPGHDQAARYDARAISRRLGDIVAGQARWKRYFARNGLEPLWLYYEDVVADPLAAALAVARLMGVALPIDAGSPRVDLSIQRDALNEAWRCAFLADARGLAKLDRLEAAGPPGVLPRLGRRLARRGGRG